MRGPWDEPSRDPLAALRDGEPSAFDAFVELEAVTLLGFFRRLGARPEEAEDLTQDTFVKLYRSAPRYAARERFSSYVYRVARNAWIDSERRRSVRPAPALGGESDDGPESRMPSSDPGALRLAESAEAGDALDRALATLSEAHRTVFELGALQQLPYEQISELLEIPVGTVKSRMFNAVRKLRTELPEDFGRLGTEEGDA